MPGASQTHAGLIRERALFAHRATLFPYLAANGVEVQRSPANDTTLCLTATSIHLHLPVLRAFLIDALLARCADSTLVDTQTRQSPAQWAREAGHSAIAEKLEGRPGQ